MCIGRGNLLSNLIAVNKYTIIADIGVSSCCTVEHIKGELEGTYHHAIEMYFGIDPYQDTRFRRDRLREQKLSFWLPWRFMMISSDEAAEDIRVPLDLVFIDGSHRPEQMTKDIQTWFGKLKEGGCIVGHDYMNPVKQSIDGDYTLITDWINKNIGKDNLNYKRDRRDENGKPNYLWWSYKVDNKYSKDRR
jgi:hypothetical protein